MSLNSRTFSMKKAWKRRHTCFRKGNPQNRSQYVPHCHRFCPLELLSPWVSLSPPPAVREGWEIETHQTTTFI